MNLLSKSDVFAENKLFATLDTTVRKVVINQVPFLLSDTVGFIRKLPHQLVESFKSTLDEVREADVLIHVVDASHPVLSRSGVDSVNETLNELLDQPKPILICFNKMDNLNVEALQALMNENRKSEHEFVFISAIKKLKIDQFKQKLFQIVEKLHFTRFPFNTTVIN